MNRLTSRQWALSLMLLSLHGVMLGGFGSALSLTLLLIHYGLFLLWQPIWRGEQKLSPPATLLFLAGAGILLWSINWWVLAFWEAALFGLLGGRVFSTQEKSPRLGYLIAAAYLIGMLLLWVVPKLLIHTEDIAAARSLAIYVLPLLPVGLLLLPAERDRAAASTPPLDFFYTLLLFLLAVILMLGSFAIEVSSNTNYAVALMRMLFGIAAVLMVMSWLWNPRAGFAGIGNLLSRYLLSVGMPFEQWLNRITRLAEAESSPSEFMLEAATELASLPWVSGGSWRTAEGKGDFGSEATYSASFDYHDFGLTLHARQPLTPVMMLHIKLLTQLLGEFYEAKKREAALREQSYMRAVYETGSRLTHDIKNLVQSLSVLCSAAQQASSGDEDRLVALIKRQLPQLNRRLELTLEKLQTPKPENLRQIKTLTWWRAVKQRYAGANIAFSSHGITAASELYPEVFDNVIDNLLQNALEKARIERGLHIAVMLGEADGPYLEVSDDGHAIAKEVAARLFQSRVESENGLGIGLLHAARQAQRIGYTLKLADNWEGKVRFILLSSGEN